MSGSWSTSPTTTALKPPIIIEDLGPVLDVEDIVTGKVRAFVDRGVERDYSDIASILNTHRWTIQDLYAKARSVFPISPHASSPPI